MIINLKKGLGLHLVERIVAHLEEKGLEVYARNAAGPVVLVAIGETSFSANEPHLFGIEKHREGVGSFLLNPALFIGAREYIALREQKKFELVLPSRI